MASGNEDDRTTPGQCFKLEFVQRTSLNQVEDLDSRGLDSLASQTQSWVVACVHVGRVTVVLRFSSDPGVL